MEALIHQNYPLIVKAVYSGTSVNKAVAKAGMSRTSLYKWRYMAEMKIVDAAHYNILQEQFQSSATLSAQCRRFLSNEYSPFSQVAKQMREDKKLLPLC